MVRSESLHLKTGTITMIYPVKLTENPLFTHMNGAQLLQIIL